MNKRLIIDCQLLQTKTWHRGMGKYSAKLLDGMMNEAARSEYSGITLLFNADLTYEESVEQFVASLNDVTIEFLSLHVPKEDPRSITIAQRKNRKILDDYIAASTPTYDIHFMIASLFLDEACPVFPTDGHKSIICYDLIPLMYYKLYLGLGPSEQYFTRFSVFLEADAVMAISETVANDIVSYIGIPKEKIFNINGASNWIVADGDSPRPDLPISDNFLLMPTGGDPRKNNLNGVIGFERFNRQNGNKYQLVITSIFTDEQKEDLSEYSSSILFTGNVSDDELRWLYENSKVVLFPTEYEGLGMPVLEAIDADKLIACSDIPVFREISSEAFFMFDPRDPESISNAIEESIIASDDEIRLKKRHYAAIQKTFTWENSAKEVLRAIAVTSKSRIKAVKSKRSIAIVTPNISYDSELSRYVALNYAGLSEDYEIDFYYDMSGKLPPVRPNFLGFVAGAFHLRELDMEIATKYDLVIYFIEDTVVSKATLATAAQIPGLVVSDSGSDFKLPGSSVTFVPTAKAKNEVAVTAGQLGFPLHRQGFDNHIFIHLDARRTDDRWNIDYIKDIASVVDISRVGFTVATKTRFSEEVRSELAYANVSLYENVADFEYNVLLNTCDLFVDARPGASFTKLFDLAEAQANNLTVFSGDMGSVKDTEVGYTIAKDGAAMRDMTFKWLMRDIDRQVTDSPEIQTEAGLKPIIRSSIEARSKR